MRIVIGSIIGDIVGSRFEWNNLRSKEFDFLHQKCFFTDDSVMSLAVAQAILDSGKDLKALGKAAVQRMQELGRRYPHCSYGGHFAIWLASRDPKPYGSYGNGAAMRVSACAFAASSLEEAQGLARAVTEVTHNHPEGIKGAEAAVSAMFLALQGKKLPEIRQWISQRYYPMDFTLDEIRGSYRFNETCQETVPQALEAAFESADFEDAIRCAISIGGDSDTVAAITGGVAEAAYGVPAPLRQKAEGYLDTHLLGILRSFEARYPWPRG